MGEEGRSRGRRETAGYSECAHSPFIPNPFVCRAEHRPVVVAITRCDGGKVKLPKALYTLSFWVRLPEFIVQDFARFGIDVQLVAEQGWV